jgi:hypothetical protein
VNWPIIQRSTFLLPIRRGPETRDPGASKPALFAWLSREHRANNRLTPLTQFEGDDERRSAQLHATPLGRSSSQTPTVKRPNSPVLAKRALWLQPASPVWLTVWRGSCGGITVQCLHVVGSYSTGTTTFLITASQKQSNCHNSPKSIISRGPARFPRTSRKLSDKNKCRSIPFTSDYFS